MRQAIHFVGFRGEEYHSAVRVFGRPDFIHPVWDTRAAREIADGDVLVFANKETPEVVRRNGDDYIEFNDPARKEMGR